MEGNQLLMRVRKAEQSGEKREFSLKFVKQKGRSLY